MIHQSYFAVGQLLVGASTEWSYGDQTLSTLAR